VLLSGEAKKRQKAVSQLASYRSVWPAFDTAPGPALVLMRLWQKLNIKQCIVVVGSTWCLHVVLFPRKVQSRCTGLQRFVVA